MRRKQDRCCSWGVFVATTQPLRILAAGVSYARSDSRPFQQRLHELELLLTIRNAAHGIDEAVPGSRCHLPSQPTPNATG